MKFTVIIVCKDGGEKLRSTAESALRQDYPDLEVLVKDACSAIDPRVILRDSDHQRTSDDPRLRIEVSPDQGIYDGMSQAISIARGDYLIFLNCGDLFADEKVLSHTAAFLKAHPGTRLAYGDRINALSGHREYSPGRITPFVLFRGIPCHQSCFYHKSLFAEKGYNTAFRIRADQEHFFRSYHTLRKALAGGEKDMPILPMHFPVCIYEGGGFSEEKKNQALSEKEHREICRRYLSLPQRILFRAYLILTLQPLRKKIAESKQLGGAYQRLKKRLQR